MDNICIELGISKRTLYEKFDNKNQLVEEIFTIDWKHFSQELESVNCENTDAVYATFCLFDLINKKQKSASVKVISDLKKYHPQLINKIEAVASLAIDQKLKDILQYGIACNDFRKEIHPVEVCGIIYYIFSSYAPMVVFQLSKNILPYSLEKLLNYHFDSICTNKGLKRWNEIMDILKTAQAEHDINMAYVNSFRDFTVPKNY